MPMIGTAITTASISVSSKYTGAYSSSVPACCLFGFWWQFVHFRFKLKSPRPTVLILTPSLYMLEKLSNKN